MNFELGKIYNTVSGHAVRIVKRATTGVPNMNAMVHGSDGRMRRDSDGKCWSCDPESYPFDLAVSLTDNCADEDNLGN